MTIDDAPDVLTVQEVALLLRVGRNSVYQLIAEGRIYAARIGRSLRVPKTAAISFLNGEVPTEPQLRVVGRSGTG